uniref:Uncharacterized protein n=1 Tax=Meloidogyne javanica TaxID=6303 RepID=A0A915MEH7_MELJA
MYCNLNEGKLDNEELPECIDKQLIEIKCEPFLEVKKIGNGLTEPILIVWPQITDNDPYFNIRPLNIPLVHQNIPISLPDNLTEIQWEVVDRHGINIKCFTKLKFLEEEKKKNNLERFDTPSNLNKCIRLLEEFFVNSSMPLVPINLFNGECPNGFFGEFCESKQNNNLKNNSCKCLNGGECIENNLCKCLIGFYGNKCQFKLNPCNLFNGLCVKEENYECNAYFNMSTGAIELLCKCGENNNNEGSGINCENSEENLFIDGDNSMDILENPCQQKPDYCNNAGECHLLPNTTHRYCKCLPPFTGIYCETTRSTKISIKCPESQQIILDNPDQRLINVNWDDSFNKLFPFSIQNPIVRLESNFRPGQIFTWGYHRIIYYVEDSFGYWNSCEGKWNHWENIGIPFEFPSCSSTENVLQEIEGNLNFNGFCSNYNEYQDEISLFGNNFNEEQTRLSCSDNFPQLDIENKPNINISDPNSLPIIQCSTCAPGETWKDTEQKFSTITTKNFDFILNKNVSSGKCEKCPPNTFKTTEGIQNCIPCPDGRITGENCSPGYIYSWENDKCIPCPRGQFMPYSGRLKCLACPIDRTTVGEGSINKEGCSIKCKDGEEMGQNEQCKPCMKGTFREGLMSNEFGSNKCKKCPEGYITKQLGAKNIFECDQVWDGSCKPDQPEPCPNGSECIQIRGEIFEYSNGRLCVFTMDEEIENQKYQIKRKDSSSEKSKGKEFPSPELVTQINLTNVELRRIKLEKQLKITPFQTGLRSSLTARNINRLPPPNNNLKKKHPPTNTPSYDDDDDAFFS